MLTLSQFDCPEVNVGGQSVFGAWDGYLLSTDSTTGNITKATAALTFAGTGSDSLTATLALTGCDDDATECVPKAEKTCTMKFKISCLTFGHPEVYGFTSTEDKNDCMYAPSDWHCKYHMTGRKYQDLGHGAAFYTSMRWDTTASHDPLRLDPFGTFDTGCPDDNTKYKLSGRFSKKNATATTQQYLR